MLDPACRYKIHLIERSGVLFHEDLVLLQEEGPDGGFDSVEHLIGVDLKAHGDFLVPTCSDCRSKDLVEINLGNPPCQSSHCQPCKMEAWKFVAQSVG
jgi:hypothetical protein